MSLSGQVQTVAKQGREGTQRQGRRGVKKQSQEVWGQVLVPSQGIHLRISRSCFADTESPAGSYSAAHKLETPDWLEPEGY